jgi:hypothetical protein
MMRKAEAARDKIMRGVGTDEPWVVEHGGWSMHYRKPLRVDEVNRMAPTQDVRAREGRV